MKISNESGGKFGIIKSMVEHKGKPMYIIQDHQVVHEVKDKFKEYFGDHLPRRIGRIVWDGEKWVVEDK